MEAQEQLAQATLIRRSVRPGFSSPVGSKVCASTGQALQGQRGLRRHSQRAQALKTQVCLAGPVLAL